MKITTFEYIQRSENGGAPLDNDTAHELRIGHGTPVVLMPKRQFVALLKQLQLSAMLATADPALAKEVEKLLKEHDQFISPVSPSEIMGKSGPTRARDKREGPAGATWSVLSMDDETVRLSGPGPCRGIRAVSRDEFDLLWEEIE